MLWTSVYLVGRIWQHGSFRRAVFPCEALDAGETEDRPNAESQTLKVLWYGIDGGEEDDRVIKAKCNFTSCLIPIHICQSAECRCEYMIGVVDE